ncbi:MAG: hypothetical protein PHN44_05730 [Candidatus Marinimicrobia bacterium]|nr:hypothetical protein [Candidatus Neomarinimicrobiota bacterium]
MNKQKAIEIIEQLFPADSQYEDTAAIGKRLLDQAKEEIDGWRNLPEPVLVRYAELCEAEENKQVRKFQKEMTERG